MTDKALIDTNILIYAESRDDTNKHRLASAAIQATDNAVISVQNASEFSKYFTKNTKLSAADINEIISTYERSLQILGFNLDTVKEANEIERRYSIHFFDALIASTMKENEVYTIITENEKDFVKVPWIKVVNPFK